MPDGQLKIGDTAHDLVKRGKVQVVGKAADTVRKHREREDYDIASYRANALLDVADDEPVYTCVYLPDEPTTSFSGTYDFPRSRLARVPLEAANQDLDRVQRDIVMHTLAAMVGLARSLDDTDMEPAHPESYVDAVRECWPADHAAVLEDAVQLAEATQALDEHVETAVERIEKTGGGS